MNNNAMSLNKLLPAIVASLAILFLSCSVCMFVRSSVALSAKYVVVCCTSCANNHHLHHGRAVHRQYFNKLWYDNISLFIGFSSTAPSYMDIVCFGRTIMVDCFPSLIVRQLSGSFLVSGLLNFLITFFFYSRFSFCCFFGIVIETVKCCRSKSWIYTSLFCDYLENGYKE